MIKYVVGLALVAMFVIPGSASEFAAVGAQPHALSVTGGGSTAGLFNDPDGEPSLSITLPTRFVAVDTAIASSQHFGA